MPSLEKTNYMYLDFDQVRHKMVRTITDAGYKLEIKDLRPCLTQTALNSHRNSLDASNFGFKKKMNCTSCVVKTKALISCAVTGHGQKSGFLLTCLI